MISSVNRAANARRFFFVPHGPKKLDPPPRLRKGAPPWRVPYAVRGSMVSRTGVETTEGVVMGDGYQVRGGPVVVGGNKDAAEGLRPLHHEHGIHRHEVARSVRLAVENDVARACDRRKQAGFAGPRALRRRCPSPSATLDPAAPTLARTSTT